jgi:hypothetical protein
MKTISTVLVLLFPFLAGAETETEPWAPLEFLAGTWQGDGKAEDASGKGVTTFNWEVGHKVPVHRDRAEYPAMAQRPAFTYEALMVIYENPASKKIEAQYFDGENHVINYKLVPGSPPDSAQFGSDAPGAPCFV